MTLIWHFKNFTVNTHPLTHACKTLENHVNILWNHKSDLRTRTRRNKKKIYKKHVGTSGLPEEKSNMAPRSSAKRMNTILLYLNLITNTRQWRIYLTIRYDLLALQLHFVTRLAYNKGQINPILADNKGYPSWSRRTSSEFWRLFSFLHGIIAQLNESMPVYMLGRIRAVKCLSFVMPMEWAVIWIFSNVS